MKIWLDMDGTIANLYAVENWLPKLRAFDPDPLPTRRTPCPHGNACPLAE